MTDETIFKWCSNTMEAVEQHPEEVSERALLVLKGLFMQEQSRSYLFTSESVTEGHPDKVCDQISDAILDALLEKEIQLAEEGYIAPDGSPANPELFRCACETLATTGMIFVTGEIRTQAYVDTIEIVRGVLKDIGYDRAKYGFDCATCGVLNAIHDQSPDIAQGVDDSFESQRGEALDPYDQIGAGDQGMVFGYACDDTKTLMPMPIYLAHRLSERLAQVRKDETMPYLRPDGKTQVSVRYVDGVPTQVEKVVVSTQHSEEVDPDFLRGELIRNVIDPVFAEENVTVADDVEIFVNPTGRFVIGGPMGDAGLTGRKIIVDTYGGMGRHGGGAFSGKDCTKVDRSAAYAARWVAKNIVAAGLAKRCEVQIAYAIGMARPVSLMVETFGTGTYSEDIIAQAVDEVFDLRPGAIIDALDLRRPIYRKTAAYGHFGRELPEFTWEKRDKVEALQAAVARLS
ncbi:s-adenosylmethionine synthase 1 [Eggerthella sp. CAG:1427]|nr:s-adenosylmethionine synthase 1 [Eggerthella sp. CAG:1427]